MWVCRAGKNAEYLDIFIKSSKIFLVWDGFDVDLSEINEMDSFRNIVQKERGVDNRTSISNWAGQLRAFSKDMCVGDYVLIPDSCSQHFALVKIIGGYSYKAVKENGLVHSHDVEVLVTGIPKSEFSKEIQYGLRAYRTIYKVRNEEEILNIIDKWRQKEKVY